jgi:hypothetical protein
MTSPGNSKMSGGGETMPHRQHVDGEESQILGFFDYGGDANGSD